MKTRADVDALLAYLPIFEEPGRSWFVEGRWYQYTPEVSRFFGAALSGWLDPGYVPSVAGAMLADDARVAQASLEEVQQMLTYCARLERFSSGAWGGLLGEGRVQALLRRLAVLRDALPG